MPIRVYNIVFRNRAQIMPHESPNLYLAESVSIDFGEQKSNVKDKTLSQDNNNKEALNPVTLFVATVKRLQSYPEFDDSWEIFTFYDGTKFSKIASCEIMIDLRSSVDAIVVHILGFTGEDIGNHSVQAFLAMMVYLVREPVYTIMLICRWNSDAFLAKSSHEVSALECSKTTPSTTNH